MPGCVTRGWRINVMHCDLIGAVKLYVLKYDGTTCFAIRLMFTVYFISPVCVCTMSMSGDTTQTMRSW